MHQNTKKRRQEDTWINKIKKGKKTPDNATVRIRILATHDALWIAVGVICFFVIQKPDRYVHEVSQVSTFYNSSYYIHTYYNHIPKSL